MNRRDLIAGAMALPVAAKLPAPAIDVFEFGAVGDGVITVPAVSDLAVFVNGVLLSASQYVRDETMQLVHLQFAPRAGDMVTVRLNDGTTFERVV